jgi:acetyl-CoA acetyltransferase
MSFERRSVAIAAVGETRMSATGLGKSNLQLMAEAARSALRSIGMPKDEIQGVFVSTTKAQYKFMYAETLAAYLGIRPRAAAQIVQGGTTPHNSIAHAAAMIAAGMADNVLIAYASSQMSELDRDGVLVRQASDQSQFEVPWGMLAATSYGMLAQRHMYEYGTTSAQLARFAVVCREHAARHPNAQNTAPITVEDVLASRMISSPFHLLDICVIGDGACAAIVSSATSARRYNPQPAYILGYAEHHHRGSVTGMGGVATTSGQEVCGPAAFEMARVTTADVDVLQLYDDFTMMPMIMLEDLGFCPKGQCGPFVENTDLGIEGELPTNTFGGMLSHGNTVGFGHVVEGARQVMGTAGATQVANADIALIAGLGGLSFSSNATLILGR